MGFLNTLVSFFGCPQHSYGAVRDFGSKIALPKARVFAMDHDKNLMGVGGRFQHQGRSFPKIRRGLQLSRCFSTNRSLLTIQKNTFETKHGWTISPAHVVGGYFDMDLRRIGKPLVKWDGLGHDAPIMTAHKIGGRIRTRRKI